MTLVLILRAWGKVRPIEVRGLDVVQIPVVRTVPNEDVIRGVRLSGVDYVIVMSSLVAKYMSSKLRSELDGSTKIIGVGPTTCNAIKELGLPCDMPSEYSSSGIVSYMRGFRPCRVVVLRSMRGSDLIRRGLTELGFEVVEYGVYDVIIDEVNAALACRLIEYADYVVFMSPMTYEAVRRCVGDRLGSKFVIAIGSTTASRIKEDGIRVLTPSEYTQEGVLNLINQLINSELQD
ncbi:MAG: uroporphyrinogen-III synthase [Vulcanisaeta sp. AZ3]